MLILGKVAVTGGLSCGKSSICQLLKELGAYVVSADSIVHQLLSSDPEIAQEVVALLGPDIVVNQKIDRSRVARLVFQDLERLSALEAILHPVVYQKINQMYQEQKTIKPSIFIVEIPLLFENGREKDFDVVIAVVANEEVCLKRFEQTTGYNIEEFNRRIARQLPLLEKAIRSDYVIMNNGTLDDLKPVVLELYQELIGQHSGN